MKTVSEREKDILHNSFIIKKKILKEIKHKKKLKKVILKLCESYKETFGTVNS